MTSVPKQASAFRKDGHIILKDHVCKIVKMHGHAKINFTGLDIFSNNKYEELQSATHSMQEPEVKRDDYDVIDIVDEFASLTNIEGDSLELRIPKNEIGENLKKAFEEGKIMIAIVTSAMGETRITQFKEEK
ncbi:eukaryotic translation initiation factor 5a [Anaeramoeba flamelloides]|uniref:Eukaryotic translation initiation factor 5A n=1 Tax=Anaeramoeba flamelloides TaxID=1746091 RepID=A0AAV7ZJK8_9EUKA|nr:eukaryotic translation initiation factor 5a [Anaeramoeba flamelloides]